MTSSASLARVHEIETREARKHRNTETTPWWVEPLIGTIMAVMVWLLFVGC